MHEFNERLTMAKRRIQAMRHKRATVYARHSVDIEGYNVTYIDNAINLPVRIN
jgi:hypothetical protein